MMPLLEHQNGFESTDEENDDAVLQFPSNIPGLNLDWVNPVDFNNTFLPHSLALCELPGYRFRSLIRSLPEDLGTLQQQGITDVICLLTKAEFQKYKVSKLFQVTSAHFTGKIRPILCD